MVAGRVGCRERRVKSTCRWPFYCTVELSSLGETLYAEVEGAMLSSSGIGIPLAPPTYMYL